MGMVKQRYQMMIEPEVITEVIKLQTPVGGRLSPLVQFLLKQWVQEQKELMEWKTKMESKIKEKITEKKNNDVKSAEEEITSGKKSRTQQNEKI